MKKLWFKRKQYGWGWYPASREGWLATLLYGALIILFAVTIDEYSSFKEIAVTAILPIVLISIAFICLAYRTGEKPRWQWGEKK